MAEIPPRQPGVHAPGDDAGARPARRRRLRHLALAALAGAAALNIADYSGVVGIAAVDDVALTALVACALFALAGFGPTRLLLPDALRGGELLWILPVGACALALEMAALGYARVPFVLNLVVVLVASGALAVYAVRRHGLPAWPDLPGIGWPLFVAVLVACVALIPVFRAGIPVVTGTGSDAHLAAGTAHFLTEHHPTAVAPEEPVDRVPLVWRSKPPIYYPLAAVSELTGQETWEALAPVASLLLALAAIGFFLLARDGLGAGLAGATVGMAAVGLDRVVLQTVTHPYFNQTWGFFTLPFALLLAWRRAYALMALFLAVGAFAYPLMLPIPLVALAVLLWPERGKLRSLWRGPRSLWWMVPLGLVALVPLQGVIEKSTAAFKVVVDPTESLGTWGGDLERFIPEHQFVGMPSTSAMLILAIPLVAAIVYELRRQPRELAWSLAAVLLFGALAAAWFRPREFGWYFHFKALAFVAPLAVLIAVVGLSRLRARWAAAAALTVMVGLGVQGARDEMVITFDQTPPWLTQIREIDARLPPGASVRLDLEQPMQLWAGYFLAGQPLCSEEPLLGTSYPRVRTSRRADYALRDRGYGTPPDAVGGPLWANERFTLHRLDGTAPGRENCSQRMVQDIESIDLAGRAR